MDLVLVSHFLFRNFFSLHTPCRGEEISLRWSSLNVRIQYHLMHQATQEFSFVSETPQKKTRKSLLSQVRQFWSETDGGAIPIPLAAKMLNMSPETIRKYVKNGKVREFRFGKQALVQIDDLEALLDLPKAVGGRPKKIV